MLRLRWVQSERPTCHIPALHRLQLNFLGLEILHAPILSRPNRPTSSSTCSLTTSLRDKDSVNKEALSLVQSLHILFVHCPPFLPTLTIAMFQIQRIFDTSIVLPAISVQQTSQASQPSLLTPLSLSLEQSISIYPNKPTHTRKRGKKNNRERESARECPPSSTPSS